MTNKNIKNDKSLDKIQMPPYDDGTMRMEVTNSSDDSPKCPVTDREDMIDDCYIEIQFGYGSDKDMWTYNFGAVHDIVGKKVLETIQSLMPEGRSVEDFGVDTLAGCEEKAQQDWDNLTDAERQQQKAEWGII